MPRCARSRSPCHACNRASTCRCATTSAWPNSSAASRDRSAAAARRVSAIRRSCSSSSEVESARARTRIRSSSALRSSTSCATCELSLAWARDSCSSTRRCERTRSRRRIATSSTRNASVIPPATTASPACGRRPKAIHAATAVAPSAAASARRRLRETRSRAAPTSERAASTTATAKTIWAAPTRDTASGYAEDDEGDCESDDRRSERLEGALGVGAEGCPRDRDARPVQEVDPAGHCLRLSPEPTDGSRQEPLGVAEEGGERGGEDCLDTDRLGHGEIRCQHGKRAPGEREPAVSVEASAEELEVVRNRDERPCGDEGEEPEAGVEGRDDADC